MTSKLILPFSSKETLFLNEKESRDAGVETVSYQLGALLARTKSSDIDSIRPQVRMQKKPVLNAVLSAPFKMNQGTISFKSHIDGRRLSFSLRDLLALQSLFAHILIPYALLDESIQGDSLFRLVPIDKIEAFSQIPNIAVLYEENVREDIFIYLTGLGGRKGSSKIMVVGDMSLKTVCDLSALGVDYIETASPLKGVKKGILQTDTGEIDIHDKSYRQDHKPLSSECACYTCLHHTRAYLHHLLGFTPLLAMKLLAMHNVYYWSSQMAIR